MWSPGVFPDDMVYGLCMKGWINTIEIWRSRMAWDDLFNDDTELRSAFDAFVLEQMNSVDGKNSFLIPSRDGKYAADTLKSSDTLIFNWDSTDTSITNY
jgi:hypothetical protein